MTVHNYSQPDWKPLERAVSLAGLPQSACANFMWMCEQPEGTHQYKHRDTRNYAIVRIDSPPDHCRAELSKAQSLERTWGKALDSRLAS